MRRLVALLLVTAGCEDALDQRLDVIDSPRVVAVIAEPAEARPGAHVTYSAVIASPDGPVATAPHFAYCLAPKPPTEDNAVAVPCTSTATTDTKTFSDLGTAPTVMGTLPANGCILFGPDTPPGGFRPRDPDPSGGYYQPVRVDAMEQIAFGLSRITCKLPTAPTDVAHDYDLHYIANQNPTLAPIALADAPANSDVSLLASWPAEAVESYLYYDALSQKLVTRREAMRVSWFTTAGTIEVDATAVGETDTATTASTTWHTAGPGTAWLWFVLRDSRGGIAVQSAQITIR